MKIPTPHGAEKVIRLLERLSPVAVDKKITIDYINDLVGPIKFERATGLISTLVCLGFVKNELPTRRWKEYIDSKGDKAIIRLAIYEAYPTLFREYSDAYRQPKHVVTNWMYKEYRFSDSTLERAERVFRHLCEFAEFHGQSQSKELQPTVNIKNLQPTASQSQISFSLPLSVLLDDELVLALKNYARKNS